MGQLIVSDKDKCNLSFTCVRVCPAKAIKIADKHAQIIADRCIGCGQCVTMCAQGAINYRSDIENVEDLVSTNSKVAAICDPAISGEFTDVADYRKFVAMIREVGFDIVTEMSFAVDLIAYKYKDLVENFQGKHFITTKCPPVTSYIERQEPELVDNLAPIVPPYIAMSKVIHKRYGEDVKVVYLTACTAAKDEVKQFYHTDGHVDGVLTFVELRKLFAKRSITENTVEFSEFDPPLGRKGGLFPISHGLFQSVDINQGLLEGDILITEGRTNFLQSIKEFKSENQLSQHLDLFYCKGCIQGPGMSQGGKKFTRRSQVIKYVNKRMKAIDAYQWRLDIVEFKSLDLSRSFKAKNLRLPVPTKAEVDVVLADMGKSKCEDQLGCGACGYPSCEEFAVAHLQGLTDYEQCYTYSIKKLRSYVSKVNASNEKYKKTQEALVKSEEKARVEEALAIEASKTTTAMLNKLRAGVVIVDKRLNVLEANQRFIEMLGDDAREIAEVVPGLKGAELKSLVDFHKVFSTVLQSGQDVLDRDVDYADSIFNVSVFTIKSNEVVGGIIRDLITPEVRKEEVIKRARDVIKENLETVQQIAFLLGESASKTEKTLNSIIEAQQLGEANGIGK
ncbi:[Fe-Fe] hydrogenase large subunit C-terminal domain-containing protein [Carboxylicivirga sp. M1479]|uniref:[Fe-Fe] hydrogenase large subunit C-terminal domain-containing protein n=1 Tax=Carboxylicivirga sp. M1479 TaxID=2594476 RepID=UPI001178CB5B|nr:[Fe-Fe] hydrogenase large subunit C-terminal domain-containing protein [Carboxylicivirga sp. M1479]TRX64302.1 4Fe-4S dicluster domain-containing protein [Carboxylicivirga sp. M1479]